MVLVPGAQGRPERAAPHDGDVAIVDGLREHVRGVGWIDDFPVVVRRAFEAPDRPAHPAWEPLEACRARVATAARGLLAEHPGEDLVLVGHGTAWTVLIAELTGAPADLDRWRALGTPDLIVVDPARQPR